MVLFECAGSKSQQGGFMDQLISESYPQGSQTRKYHRAKTAKAGSKILLRGCFHMCHPCRLVH